MNNPNDKKQKVTTPLVITHFNSVMSLITLNICFLLLMSMFNLSFADWVVVIMKVSMIIFWSCGIILILGYIAAILDHNVIILEDKRSDKSSKDKDVKK